MPYYAAHRDLSTLPGGRLRLYRSWADALAPAARDLSDADAGIVTSFCPDACAAEEALGDSPALRVFYDLDTPVTLDRLARGETVPYIGPRGLADYDLVLSYTGGDSLAALTDRLGARFALPLYGSVDPDAHQPAPATRLFGAHLSYLGTYASDRQAALDRLFLEPARRRPEYRFVLGGSQYPTDFPWTPNIFYMRHVAPDYHSAFFSSSRLTLNVTREAMAATGYCPSGRLFEAAACGAPILSDAWPGLEQFFEPGREILVAQSSDEAEAAIDRSDADLRSIAARARTRALTEHTADRRAEQLEEILTATREHARVGHHSGSGRGHADSAAGLF